jgi:acyl carrier protein
MSQVVDSTVAIQDKLIKYLETQVLFDRERSTVEAGEPLFDGLLDSLDTLRLVVFIEEQFQVHVEDGEMSPENFESVRRIAEFIRRKRGH